VEGLPVAMNEKFIPWAEPRFWGNEKKYVNEALDSSWISQGAFVDQLETSFSSIVGTQHSLAVSNGPAALHLAYLACGVRPGDEVIVPAFGFLAAANVAINMGAKPIFCEVNRSTWCIEESEIKKLITSKTKAIVVIHTYGNVCDMDPITELGLTFDIPIIEDAAEAFGSRYKGKMAGSLGTIGTYSFQVTKAISTGEGGIVVCNDERLVSEMTLYRSHGLARKTKHYWHEVPGHNFRLTNLQAALGVAQLEHYSEILQARREIYNSYRREMIDMPGITWQHIDSNIDAIIWAVAIRLDPEFYPRGRDQVLRDMLDLGVELRPGFYSPAQLQWYECSALPISDKIAEQIISLPSSPTLTSLDITRIVSDLRSVS
jgi:perosamine synthetase